MTDLIGIYNQSVKFIGMFGIRIYVSRLAIQHNVLSKIRLDLSDKQWEFADLSLRIERNPYGMQRLSKACSLDVLTGNAAMSVWLGIKKGRGFIDSLSGVQQNPFSKVSSLRSVSAS